MLRFVTTEISVNEPPVVDRARFQILMENELGVPPNLFLRLLPIRAVSGHTTMSMLDPIRIAGMIGQELVPYIAVVFSLNVDESPRRHHDESLRARDDKQQRRRHFTASFPSYPGNGYMRRRLETTVNVALLHSQLSWTGKEFFKRLYASARRMAIFCRV